ncbi:MAG: TetR/AcrR family transcriptional regulator [Actinobacteria bacterium]|nr:TetR/AcrR family transcriptional regulator [Actinomycetota bacterium]
MPARVSTAASSGAVKAVAHPDVVRRRRAPARRGEGQTLRAAIVEAASTMIARTGDASTVTLRALAREVGVAATSIYLHFETVEEIIAEVKRVRLDELGAALSRAADAAGDDPVARVRARAHAYVRYGQEHPGEYAVMFSARIDLRGTAADQPIVAAAFEDLTTDVTAAFAAGGRAETPERARLVAVHLWTSLHGTVGLRSMPRRRPWSDLDEQVDDLVDRLVAVPR